MLKVFSHGWIDAWVTVTPKFDGNFVTEIREPLRPVATVTTIFNASKLSRQVETFLSV